MNRIFKAEDGTEISEEDIYQCADYTYSIAPGGKRDDLLGGKISNAAKRIRDALAPKTCNAQIRDVYKTITIPCILPLGHHLFEAGRKGIQWRCSCGEHIIDPIHSPGHMTAPEMWTE